MGALYSIPLCLRPMKHLSEFTPTDLAALASADVARALAEDVGSGDLTASLVDPSRRTRARILAREDAVICGSHWVEAAVRALDPQARLTWHVTEGQRCRADQVVLEIEGLAQPLLLQPGKGRQSLPAGELTQQLEAGEGGGRLALGGTARAGFCRSSALAVS